MQEKDYKWFIENYDDLFERYGVAYLAIKNEKVLGSYGSYGEAVKKTTRKEELGSFIVQFCNGLKTAYTITLNCGGGYDGY